MLVYLCMNKFLNVLIAALMFTATPALAASVGIGQPVKPTPVEKTAFIITATATPSTIPAKGIVQFTVAVENMGTTKAIHAKVTGALPQGFSYVTTNQAEILSDLGDIEIGKTATISFKARVSEKTAPGRYVYEPIAQASNADPVEGTVAVNIVEPKVLGATAAVLPNTGGVPMSIAFGIMLIVVGLGLRRQMAKS